MTDESILSSVLIASILIGILFVAGVVVLMRISLAKDHPPYIEYAGTQATVYVYERSRSGSRYYDYKFVNENGKWKYHPDKTVVIIVSVIVMILLIPTIIKYGLAVAAPIVAIVLLCYVIVMAVPALYAHSILKKDLQEKGMWAGRKR